MPRKVTGTVDYEQFSFINDNRNLNRGHIESLKTAMEGGTNFTKIQPILVNEDMQVIDGQHRITACMELRIPVFYVVADGLGIEEARSMNILHRNWTTDDYAQSYADSGKKAYQTYLDIKDDYGFPHSTILSYIYDGEIGGMMKKFRSGELTITDIKAVRARLDRLAQIGEYTDMVKSQAFARALLRIMRAEGYDHKHLLKKVRLHGDSMLNNYRIVEDNLRQLEDIYNLRLADRNRVRLY